MEVVKVLLVSAFIGFIYCQRQNAIEVDDIEKKLKEEIPQLEGFNASALPTDKAEEAIRAKCEQNGGVGAFDKLKEKQQELQGCFEKLVDVEVVKEELDKAAETGSMDEVFAKYCNKYPEFQKCLNNLKDALVPCLEEQEIPTMTKAFNVTKDIVDFSCVDSGDRLAMFVAEGGIECLSSKKEQLEQCINKTLGDELRNLSAMAEQESIGPLPVPLLLLEDKHIKKFNTLHNCVRDTLEQCDESTPANVVDSLFKYVKKVVFSPDAIKQAAAEENKNSATVPTITILSLLVTLLLSKLL